MVSTKARQHGAERILIAEDSRTQAEQLRLVFEENGYEVQATANGREALAAARSEPPDLVLSDINMPEMDGYELCRSLKADGVLKDVPVILVTSLSGPNDVVGGLECGADSFITKPYDEEFLLARVRHLLTNNALRGTTRVRTGIEIDIDGKRHFITAERHQILDLLISTYAAAVRLSEEAIVRGEQLRESYETLAVLHRSAEGLNRAQTETEAVTEALERLHDLHFVRGAWIWLVDEAGHIRGMESTGLTEAQIAFATSPTICSCRRDLRLGRPTEATNLYGCEGISGAGAASHATVPLCGQQRVFGVLNAVHKHGRAFANEELHVLSSLGNQITAALDRAHFNATLEQKVVERTDQLRREVAERQAAESAAVAAAERLERAQRIGRIGNAELNLRTGEDYWSAELYRMLGLDPSRVAPSVALLHDLVHPEDQHLIGDSHARTKSGLPAEPTEFRIVRPGGEVRWLYRQGNLILGDDGQPLSLAATFQDVTDRKQMEEEIRRSREHLALAQRVGNVGSCAIDLRNNQVYWSDELYRMYGVDPATTPRTLEFVLSLTHPDDRAKVSEIDKRSISGHRGEPLEFRIVRPDGETRWILRQARVIDDERGHPATLLITNQDITANKKVERERTALEEQLRQSQKMEAVGNLTGGIAHDFNNILAVVIGNLDLLNMEVPEGTEARTLVDTAISACLKGSELTKSLLAFSRRQPLQPKQVVVNQLLHDSVKMLARAIGETIEVQLDLGSGLWDVLIDPSQLESALLNMMVNARDAMPNGGQIVIGTHNTVLDQAYANENAEVTPGDYVVLEVSDTGHGIPPDVLGRVFEPFFTTKEKGKGTGLGLAMVFGFVKQSGGHIKIYSEVGHGTTLRLYLPRAGDSGGARPDAAGAEPVRATSRGEKILVVEDNPAVRRAAVKQLNGVGYKVFEVEAAAKAIEVLERDGEMDLVFSDVIMPGTMTGADLAREIGRRWPTIKVLLTSGFPEGLLENGNKLPEGVNLLSKPYRMEELFRKLREVLDA